MYWPIIGLFSGADLGNINRFSVMFSLHTQLTRDSAPDARYIRNSFWIPSRVGPARWWHVTLRPLVRTWFRPVQRSSVEVTSKFYCGFNRHQPLLKSLSVTPRFAFSVCQCFTGFSKGNFFVIARSASKALSEVGSCSRFIVGICILFCFVLYPPYFLSFPPFVHFLPCFYRVRFKLVLSVSDI